MLMLHNYFLCHDSLFKPDMMIVMLQLADLFTSQLIMLRLVNFA
jgi:hypothetical protein